MDRKIGDRSGFHFFEMVTAPVFPGTVLSGKSYTILNEKWYYRNNM